MLPMKRGLGMFLEAIRTGGLASVSESLSGEDLVKLSAQISTTSMAFWWMMYRKGLRYSAREKKVVSEENLGDLQDVLSF